MRTIKPQRAGVACRTFEHGGRHHFAVSVILYVPLHAGADLLKEQDLWPEVMPALGKDAVLDPFMPKARGEVLVTGSAHPPGGAAAATTVRVRIGSVDKRVHVIGDRRWEDDAMSRPEPFEAMPLGWDRSFGGPGFAKNPAGRGWRRGGGETASKLPNLEGTAGLIGDVDDAPEPVGLGALDETWADRASRRGTYDARWLETAFPGLAADIEWTYFNTAQPDQWIDGWFRGDEPYALEHLHPTRARIEAALPGFVGRVFVQRDDAAAGSLEELPTRLDTVHFFPGLDRAVLIFRAVTQVRDDDADEVSVLLVAAEELGAPRPASHYEAVLAKRADRVKGALEALRDGYLAPAPRVGAPAVVSPDDATRDALTNQWWQRTRGEARAAAGRAEAKARMEAMGVDPAAFDVPQDDVPVVPPLGPDDDLAAGVAAMTAQVDVILAREAEKRAGADAARDDVLRGLGVDPEAHRAVPGGPPTFTAEGTLARLRAQRDQVAADGQSTEHFDALLGDDAYRARLVEAERSLHDNYRLHAHRMPPAGRVDDGTLREQVVARLRRGEALDGLDLTGVDLRGMDLQRVSMRGALLEGALLAGACLAECDLTLAVLARCDATQADFRGARLEGANLGAAVLRRAEFDARSVLRGTVFGDADLRDAVLRGACLDGADLRGARLDRCDLSGTQAEGMVLMNVRLAQVDLSGARWTKCTLLEADLTGADLQSVCWVDTVLLRCVLDGVRAAGAVLDGVRMVEGCTVRGADLAGASLRKAFLHKVDLEGARLPGAVLDGANLMKAVLRGARLDGVRAREANFTRADLTDAVLTGGDFLDATFSKAVLCGADFGGASLFGADLLRARGDDRTRLATADVRRARVGRAGS